MSVILLPVTQSDAEQAKLPSYGVLKKELYRQSTRVLKWSQDSLLKGLM